MNFMLSNSSDGIQMDRKGEWKGGNSVMYKTKSSHGRNGRMENPAKQLHI